MQAAQGAAAYFNQGGTTIGYQAGFNFQTGSDYNTLLGYNSGYGITTGGRNVFLGQSTIAASYNQVTIGSNNISIGNDVAVPSQTASNQLDIGNFIYGTGLSGTGATVSPGNVGIGTSTPYSRLTVWGPDAASSTSLFAAVNNSSTTVFAVFDGGNAELSGTLTQNSDERLKTNIQSLDASSSLAAIDALNPVTFNWIDPSQGSTTQLGFIAQQVQPIFPNLVSTTSPTALTPNGTLGLNYIDLVSPIVSAIQELAKELTSLASTVSAFTQSITSAVGNFGQVNSIVDTTHKLCVGTTCVTPAQFQAMVAAANQSSDNTSSNQDNDTSTTTPDTPPVIQVNGDNPAIISVGATYTDLGATVTGPQQDLNLGIVTYLNGALVSNIVIDTSAVATDTIDYMVTDQSGLAATSTRTIIIQPAQSSSITPNSASSTAPTN
jgi:hypothetical protein